MNIRAIAPANDPTHTTDRLSRAAPLPLAVMLAGKGAVFVLVPDVPPMVYTDVVGTALLTMTAVQTLGLPLTEGPHD
jgi:hypothetical protein